MGVGYITGRFNSDRADVLLKMCFEEAKNKKESPVYILMPEKYTYEMEKRLSLMYDSYKDPYFRIRVVSFSTLSNMVFTAAGGVKERKISDSARNMLIYRSIENVASELKTFKLKSVAIGFVERINNVITELKQNDMSYADVMEMSSMMDREYSRFKMEDIANIYRSYENITEHEFIDSEDYLELFAEKLDSFGPLKGATVFVDEFMGFTPVQYKVVEKLIKYSENIYFSLITDLKNIGSKTGVFSKSNYTYTQIEKIRQNNNIESLGVIKVDGSGFYKSKRLEHLEKVINYFNPVRYTGSEEDRDDIKVISFGDRHREIEFVANEISRLIKECGYRYNEITVASRDLSLYGYNIKSVFGDYGIGYFLDEKIKAKDNPVIMFLLSILRLKESNYSYRAMFTYLKSGFAGIDTDDISKLENYVLANNIKGKKWFERWDKPVVHSIDENGEDDSIDEINEIREKAVRPVYILHEKLKGRNRVKDIASYLYEFAIDVRLDEQILSAIEEFKEKEDYYSAEEYSQVWNVFVDMLDETVEFIGENYIGISRFIRLMEAELEGFELGIVPPAMDQVLVTGIDRMKNPDTRALFILGMNDGVFPAVIGDDSLINDDDRKYLSDHGISFFNNNTVKINDEYFLIYKAMSMSKEKLYLTYPQADYKGKVLEPSSIIKKIFKIFDDMQIKSIKKYGIGDIYSKEALFKETFRNIKNSSHINQIDSGYVYLKGKSDYRKRFEISEKALKYSNRELPIDKDIVDELYDKEYLSVSKLEKYSNCPFSYFINYGLRARERDVFSFTSLDSGIYCHRILNDFGNRLNYDQLKWSDVAENKDYISDTVNDISSKALKGRESYILNTTARYRNRLERLNENIAYNIDVMARQFEKTMFEPRLFEMEFSRTSPIPSVQFPIDSQRMISLIGKIDRVDSYLDVERARELIRIIDYKSGNRNIDMNMVYAGLQLQLFIYMRAITDANKSVEKIAEYENEILSKSTIENLKILKEMENQSIKLTPAALLYSSLKENIRSLSKKDEILEKSGEKVQKKVFSDKKMGGYIVCDNSNVLCHDTALNAKKRKSDIVHITLSKESKNNDPVVDFDNIKTGNQVLSYSEYKNVSDFVIQKSKEICSMIYSGRVDISPYFAKDSNACTYCGYRSICQFDTSLGTNRYNVISETDTKIVLKKMEEYVRKNKGGDEDEQ